MSRPTLTAHYTADDAETLTFPQFFSLLALTIFMLIFGGAICSLLILVCPEGW